jgi:hypothetical protein
MKFCKDCKFYYKSIFLTSYSSICTFNISNVDLTTGDTEYHYAATCRAHDCLCGKEAKNFKLKTSIIRELFNFKESK